ncbi:MAG: A/G-specific adenine glycosylase [Cryomorphaceae bacterium]|nr:MAG: A/G-specific adenine glycosylase [Cryomorphaceae bacterium]
MNITPALNDWYSKNKRQLPWRNSPTPYNIWLSEMIMQQTRIAQGLPYYLRFKKAFPSIKDLAEADERDVMQLWQGLGYYRRARNLHHAAKHVVHELGGCFPGSYKELLQLKGVGPYSAAAIASICYHEPVPVVDGNVFRFLSRLFGIDTPVDTSFGKKTFYEQAAAILDHQNPGDFNQAMMEFGALVCTPAQPECAECPFGEVCVAYRTGTIEQFPAKRKRTKATPLYLNSLVVQTSRGLMLQQRPETGIWAGLYGFPTLETSTPPDHNALSDFCGQFGLPEPNKEKRIGPIPHQLTHRSIQAHFWVFNEPPIHEKEFIWVLNRKEISNFGLPRLFERFVDKYIFSTREKPVPSANE